MALYRFILENYHAIKKADILLDGLTVLAGLNGCGKSTISRWLYGFVKFSNDFDRIVDAETAEELFERNRRLYEIQRRIAFWTKTNILPSAHRRNGNLDDEVLAFETRLREVCDTVQKEMTPELMGRYGSQLWDTLGIKDEIQGVQHKLDLFVDTEQTYLADKMHENVTRKTDSSIADLYRMIESGLDIQSRGPMHLQFSENGTELLDHDYEYLTYNGKRLEYNGVPLVTDKIIGRFIAPLGMKRAIYIDSPMSVSNQTGDIWRVWSDLREMLSTPVKEMMPEARGIVTEISFILGGEVMLKDEGVGHKELRYVRRADGLNIPIDEVATGMKSFAYLLRLLQNGYIDSETLLIIDEPEAHLHPQWIVRFAKVLVLIRKMLGAKVMVASHDPDMVAAIQAMAEAEGLSDVTNFYQAYRKSGELQYDYVDCGNDTSRIFECFNIAFETIDTYRASDSL
ncbi:MAG: ATP-binding protein [Bacteroides sp.]|nr:ATP-binding protein [Bacteroides sp.]